MTVIAWWVALYFHFKENIVWHQNIMINTCLRPLYSWIYYYTKGLVVNFLPFLICEIKFLIRPFFTCRFRLKYLSIDEMIGIWCYCWCQVHRDLPVGFLLLQYSVLYTVESLSFLYLLFVPRLFKIKARGHRFWHSSIPFVSLSFGPPQVVGILCMKLLLQFYSDSSET